MMKRVCDVCVPRNGTGFGSLGDRCRIRFCSRLAVANDFVLIDLSIKCQLEPVSSSRLLTDQHSGTLSKNGLKIVIFTDKTRHRNLVLEGCVASSLEDAKKRLIGITLG